MNGSNQGQHPPNQGMGPNVPIMGQGPPPQGMPPHGPPPHGMPPQHFQQQGPPPQHFQQQGPPQHFQQQGPPPQHFQQQGPPPQGYPPNQGFQGPHPSQGFPPNQGPPPHGFHPNQGPPGFMPPPQGQPNFQGQPPISQPVLVRYKVSGTEFEIPKRYEIDNVVGQGAYGIVCAGRDKEEKESVAIKKILNIFEHELEFQKRIFREIKILKHFEHENIISLWDLLPPKSYDTFNEVYIVTDLMQTDLRQIIKSDQPLSDQHIQYFLYQILRGLKHIHSANVLHRDLKPGNILVNSDCELKICDFGLSRGVDFDSDVMMSTPYVATRWYRAPELLTMWPKASKAIDVWSVGCIFAELLNRKPLFRGKNYLNQLDLIINTLGTPAEEDIVGCNSAKDYIGRKKHQDRTPFKYIFPNASGPALDLLEKMLNFNPFKRFTVDQCLAHPYLSKLHDPEDEPTAPRFDFSFEAELQSPDLNKEKMKQMIYYEIMHWNYYQNNVSGDAILLGG